MYGTAPMSAPEELKNKRLKKIYRRGEDDLMIPLAPVVSA
jgi:hypothetical protein